jgi:raffinose/stachyose/melibiose transport system permease protein
MNTMYRDRKIILLFMLPAVLIFTLFFPFPLFASFVLSFFKWDLLSSVQFIGFRNYIQLFTIDHIFLKSIVNTTVYLIVSIILQIPAAYFLAILLTRGHRGDKLIKNTIFLPVTLSGTAVGLIFYFIYHPNIGILNNFIRLFGDSDFSVMWLGEKKYAMLAVCVSVAWQYIGYHMVIFMTGITSISTDVISAAHIDGANSLQIIAYIITPLMKPMLKVSLILITTSSLKSFDPIYVMTGGGPQNATEVMASHMYNKSFLQLQYGYGSAIGNLLMMLCVGSSALLSLIFKSEDTA